MQSEADPEWELPVGLKPHSHEQRARMTAELVPLIQRHMGGQLVALAATGSFAFDRDGPYSDLDLIGFVREPLHPSRTVVNQIYNGLLVHVWFLTRDQYLDIHKRQVGEEWVRGGSVRLVPITNAPFVLEIPETSSGAPEAHFHNAILQFWPVVQRARDAVLSNLAPGNDENALFLYWDLIDKITMALAFLNKTPLATRVNVFTHARNYALLPKSYDEIFTSPHDSDLAGMARRALAVYSETEGLLASRGLRLHVESLDNFVRPPRYGDSIRRNFKRVSRRLFGNNDDQAILQHWPPVQEATGKVLNAALSNNTENISYLYWNMIAKLTAILASLNGTKIQNRARIFSEARAFAILPKSFDALFSPLQDSEIAELRERALTAFAETERLLEAHGLVLPGGSADRPV